MKINYLLVTLLLFTFFTISFITNLLAPLFPALIESYDIGLALAGFFAFAFFYCIRRDINSRGLVGAAIW